MNVTGLHGYNNSDGDEEIIAFWGVSSWVYNITFLSQNFWKRGVTYPFGIDAGFATFLDSVFMVGDSERLIEYTDNHYWTYTENAAGAPSGRFIFAFGSRLYLYDINIGLESLSELGTRYKTRVWYSDLPENGTITWGLDWGDDLIQTEDDTTVTSAGGLFKTRNIKIGDPLFILSGPNARNLKYTVQSITDENTIELTENLKHDATGSTFWVGGNWFDVGTLEGGNASGIGLASNELIFYKENQLHRYNVTGEELRRIFDVPGTTSFKSIVNWGGHSYWYHPTGIYRTGGGEFQKISTAINDVIEGVASSYQTSVCGWVNQIDNTINFYLDTVTLKDGETITYCVATFDMDSETWSIRQYDRKIVSATNLVVDDVPRVYIGDDSSGVHQLDTGTTFNTVDIPFVLELYPIFPAGEDAVVTFDRIRAIVENGPDVQIEYKLIYAPMEGTETAWDSDDGWRPMVGSQTSSRVDWYFPTGTRASGVKLRLIESGGDESFLIEKLTIYYSTASNS